MEELVYQLHPERIIISASFGLVMLYGVWNGF